jgi:glycosyltransferase involved in cell wall biosynthesis
MLPTGIDRVGLEYVRHFGGRGRAVITYRGRAGVLPQRSSARAFATLLNGKRRPLAGAWLMSRAAVWDARFHPPQDTLLINTGHYGLEDGAYAAPLRRRRARTVVFVHDLIPISHPQYCRPGERERHIARTRTALSIAAGIVVNSGDTRRELERFAAAEGMRMPPTLVAPLASSLPPVKPLARPIAEPYFVMLGTVEPRKNHQLLLAAWERMGAGAPKLLVIGQRGWACDDIYAALKRSRDVVHKEACTDAELVTALAHAEALLMPSLAEGFGIPVVEALALGVPVLASDLPVFREFAGEVPQYLSPTDPDAWAQAIGGFIRRPASGFRAPTWVAHMAAVERFLCELS